MKLHHLRNATFVIESGDRHILIDPMLGRKGELPAFARFRHSPRRNPTVALPDNAAEVLEKVSLCLITHCQTFGIKAMQHTDHLDASGETFLRNNNIPVVCRHQDAAYLEKYGIRVTVSLAPWQPQPLPGGKITAVPAMHGRGWIRRLMANGVGYYLQLDGEPSIYISGDTVYTEAVERTLTELRPDIAVVAAGCASLDVGGPILMPMDEVMQFVRRAPGKVLANHLEALNHCPTTRAGLKQELERHHLSARTWIPEDGETLTIA